jgi:hypothetical protein
MPAQPGVNGVWNDVSAGWKTEDILAKGYPELTAEERAAGVVLLDAWEEIPREFCPKGVDAGPVLRFVATRNGRYYHSVWGGLDVADPREDAREIHDSALQACWIAWKIQQGALPAASQVQADQADAFGHRSLGCLGPGSGCSKNAGICNSGGPWGLKQIPGALSPR